MIFLSPEMYECGETDTQSKYSVYQWGEFDGVGDGRVGGGGDLKGEGAKGVTSICK